MTRRPEKKYRLQPAAVADIENIWRFSARRWSPKQADAYVGLLTQTIERIAANPQIARERSEFSPSVRILPAGAHVVIYVIQDDGVIVVRIRHAGRTG